jgi:hypothetical protein
MSPCGFSCSFDASGEVDQLARLAGDAEHDGRVVVVAVVGCVRRRRRRQRRERRQGGVLLIVSVAAAARVPADHEPGPRRGAQERLLEPQLLHHGRAHQAHDREGRHIGRMGLFAAEDRVVSRSPPRGRCGVGGNARSHRLVRMGWIYNSNSCAVCVFALRAPSSLPRSQRSRRRHHCRARARPSSPASSFARPARAVRGRLSARRERPALHLAAVRLGRRALDSSGGLGRHRGWFALRLLLTLQRRLGPPPFGGRR